MPIWSLVCLSVVEPGEQCSLLMMGRPLTAHLPGPCRARPSQESRQPNETLINAKPINARGHDSCSVTSQWIGLQSVRGETWTCPPLQLTIKREQTIHIQSNVYTARLHYNWCMIVLPFVSTIRYSEHTLVPVDKASAWIQAADRLIK